MRNHGREKRLSFDPAGRDRRSAMHKRAPLPPVLSSVDPLNLPLTLHLSFFIFHETVALLLGDDQEYHAKARRRKGILGNSGRVLPQDAESPRRPRFSLRLCAFA